MEFYDKLNLNTKDKDSENEELNLENQIEKYLSYK